LTVCNISGVKVNVKNVTLCTGEVRCPMYVAST
jgi:hypothetical protein